MIGAFSGRSVSMADGPRAVGTGSLKSCGLGVWRGLRPSLSRCDFVLLSKVKGLGLEVFFVGVEFWFGSPSANEVSDFDGKEGVGA